MSRLKFEKREIEADKDVGAPHITYYHVTCKGEEVGLITNEHWNRWTWEQTKDIIMSRGCLTEVVDFMQSLGGKD